MIIFRYFTREIGATLSAISAILLLIFLSNQFVHYLSKAVTGKFPSGMLFHLILIEIPHLLCLLMPLGLFLAILLVYGRFCIDNEMTVLFACGMSRAKLVALTMPITGIVMVVVTILSLWITPLLLGTRDRLLAETGTEAQIEATLPGRFEESGQRIFYVENISADRQNMKNIFMAQAGRDTTSPIPDWIIVVADKGSQTTNKTNGDRFFVASNGHRYEGIPGQNDFKILQFDSYGARMESHLGDVGSEAETKSLSQLFHAKQDRAVALSELQWRFSLPLSVILLALLAIPLSYIKPRFGRYAQLLPAILIYILYANFLMVGRSWIENGSIVPWIGLWWIHLALALLVGIIWWNQIIGFPRTWRYLKKRWDNR